MNEIKIILIAFAAFQAITLAGCVFLLKQQRANYESLLADARADNRDLRDRMFMSKAQPPTGTDMRAHHEQKEQARTNRRLTAPKSSPDPTAHLKNTLASQEMPPSAAS